jgi:hypothetical protein
MLFCWNGQVTPLPYVPDRGEAAANVTRPLYNFTDDLLSQISQAGSSPRHLLGTVLLSGTSLFCLFVFAGFINSRD